MDVRIGKFRGTRSKDPDTVAIVAGLLWYLLDRRNEDCDLFGWLRLIVRLTLGVAMLRYGFIKVFPIQFPMPPFAVLDEPVGNASPTMLFWSLYGIRPHFVMFLAWTEVIAGLALLFVGSWHAQFRLAPPANPKWSRRRME